MSPFAIGALSGVGVVVLAAAISRGRFFATFAGVILGAQALLAIGLYPLFEPIWPVFVYLQVATQLHFLSLARARMRPLWWRLLVSIPGLFFAAGCYLGVFWAVPAAFGLEPWAPWLPFVGAAFGLWQSLDTRSTLR